MLTTNFQMMIRWPWLQRTIVEDKDGQKRRRKGPNIQDQVVGCSSIIAATKVI